MDQERTSPGRGSRQSEKSRNLDLELRGLVCAWRAADNRTRQTIEARVFGLVWPILGAERRRYGEDIQGYVWPHVLRCIEGFSLTGPKTFTGYVRQRLRHKLQAELLFERALIKPPPCMRHGHVDRLSAEDREALRTMALTRQGTMNQEAWDSLIGEALA